MFHIERANSNRRITWWSLVGLALLPLLVAGGLLATTWGRDARLQHITAAVVNLDQAVTLQGQMVPMGRQLAAAMIDRDDDNIDWVLADQPTADTGLADGRYSAVVTIPQEFSAAATSFAANDPDAAKQATIQVHTSPAGAVQDGEIARQIASMAVSTVNATITGSYLENVFVGFATTGEQLGTMADSARQLADGADQLADGVGQTRVGVTQLAGGLGTLDEAGSPLSSGGVELADGGNQLASGASQLDDGVQTLAGSVTELTDGAAQLNAGTAELSGGIGQLATGVRDYTDGTAAAVNGFGSIAGGISQVKAGLDTATFDISALTPLQNGAQGVADEASGLSSGVSALADDATNLADGATGLGQSAASLGATARGLVTGAGTLASDATQLADGLRAHRSALSAYASGSDTITMPDERTDQAAAQFVESCAAAGTDQATCQQMLPAFLGGVRSGWAQGVRAAGTAAVDDLTTAGPGGAALDAAAQTLAADATTWQQQAPGFGTDTDQFVTDAGQFSDDASQFAAEVKPLVDDAAGLATGAARLAAGIDHLVTTLPASIAASMTPLRSGIDQLDLGASTLATESAQLVTGGTTLADGADQSAAGAAQLADGMSQLTGGLPQMVDGIDQLAAGTSELSIGTGTLASGIGTYVDGVSQYTAGLHAASTGAVALSDGIAALYDGSDQLASGVGTFASKVGEGAEQVPSFDEAQRQQLSTVVATPVADTATGFGAPLVPVTTLLLVLGLWCGALALFLVIRPRPSRVLTSSRPTWQLAAATMVPGAAVAVVQALAVGVLGVAVLKLPFGSSVRLIGLLTLASLTFMGVNHALAAWLHGAGRVLAVVLAVVGVAAGTISAVPTAFTSVQGFSPLNPAMNGVRAIVAGTSLTAPVGLLVAWMIGAGVAGLLAVVAKRQLSVSQYRKAQAVAAD